MTQETIIHMKDVRKSFGDVEVLRDFSMEIPARQKIVILGPSGSGKSTVLRILMTLEDIDSGTVMIDGKMLWRAEDGRSVRAKGAELKGIRGEIGMVFQHFNLFPHMNVLRNVTEAPVRVLGLSAEEARRQALELLENVGLGDKTEAWPAQLSGGQKQRVAIARALAMRPRIMLFDEVTSALDPELVGEVLGVLKKLAKESEMTMLFVTHHLEFAREIADRLVFMDHGIILHDSPPADFFTKTDNERVRRFLDVITQQ
ncbi:MAG: amino acid ABC transporter ATP-binding protein [Candidatus Nitrospinota bacterium M3_3B_026]